MRKKSEFTTVERAIQTIDGFEKVYKTLQQQTILRGQSQSTLDNYIRQIALISLEFNKLPEDLSEDDINGYLTTLAMSPKSPSRSSFKHAIYGLRYYYRHIGQTKRAINLPSLKQEAKLPVILNREELRQLFKAPTLLKHRIALALIYSGGLRSQEASNMKISDIDFVRKTIHIRQSKYKKDRIVPLSDSCVTFFYKDYKDKSKVKPTTLSGVEFLRRFCMHILPKRFVKIRYYGILSTKQKERVKSLNVKKPAIKIKESRQERIVRLTGFNYNLCPVCKTGFMYTIEMLPKIRAPVNVLYEKKILSC